MKINDLNNLKMISLLSAIALSVACGGPNEVDGQVAEDEFSVHDSAPELRVDEDNGDATMIFAEQDGDSLRTIVMLVPGNMDIVAGEPISLDSDSELLIELGVGELETFEANGRTVVNSRDAVFYEVVSGTIIFDSLSDPVSGWFSVELADGSVVKGFFSLEGSIR